MNTGNGSVNRLTNLLLFDSPWTRILFGRKPMWTKYLMIMNTTAPIRKHMGKILFFLLLLTGPCLQAQKTLRFAIAGLAHDHVHGILNQYKKGEVIISGIAEADEQLVERYKKTYQLPDTLFYKNLESLLAATKTDAVLA